MYKDKDKQREANRLANRRYRAKNKENVILDKKQGLENTPERPVTEELRDIHAVIPSKRDTVIPNFGQPDCQNPTPLLD